MNPLTDHGRDQSSNRPWIPGNEHDSAGLNPAMNQQRDQSRNFGWGAANYSNFSKINFHHTKSNPGIHNGRDQSSICNSMNNYNDINQTGLNPSTDRGRDQFSNHPWIPGKEHDSAVPNPAMNQHRDQSSNSGWGAGNYSNLYNINFDHTGSNLRIHNGKDQSSIYNLNNIFNNINRTGLNPSTDHGRDQSSNYFWILGNKHDNAGPSPSIN